MCEMCLFYSSVAFGSPPGRPWMAHYQLAPKCSEECYLPRCDCFEQPTMDEISESPVSEEIRTLDLYPFSCGPL